MKKVLIALLIVISSFTVAFCADKTEYCAADELYVMGLFNGVGTDVYGNPKYDLDNKLNREQAVTLLVRLLGKEQEALSQTWDTPFNDLSDWAAPYVGYAYTKGLTKGVSDTKFGSSDTASDLQYYTFLLRALGYKDGVDFTWDKAQELTDQLEITSGKYSNFTRGKVCLVSVKAIDTKVNGKDYTLLDAIPGITEEQLWHRQYAQKASINITEAEAFYNQAKNINISKYKIPAALGKQTLSFDEAEALVGRAPIIVQNRVQNFADAIQYSVAASFGAGQDAFTPWYGNSNEAWGYDWDGEVQLANNWFTCCGGAANYLQYLLAGDYDSQGWFQFLGGGNHHFNWVKTDGKYYILDLTKYINAGRYNGSFTNIIVADSIEDFWNNKWPDYYASKSDITTVYYGLCEDGTAFPSDFQENHLIAPKNMKGKITMILAGGKSDFTYKDPTVKIPGYNVFEYVQPSNNSYVQDKIEYAEATKAIFNNSNSAVHEQTNGEGIELRFTNTSMKGIIVPLSSTGFGCGHDDIILEVLYNGKVTSNYTISALTSTLGTIQKGSDGLIHCTYNSGTGSMSFTITMNGGARTVSWVIS